MGLLTDWINWVAVAPQGFVDTMTWPIIVGLIVFMTLFVAASHNAKMVRPSIMKEWMIHVCIGGSTYLFFWLAAMMFGSPVTLGPHLVAMFWTFLMTSLSLGGFFFALFIVLALLFIVVSSITKDMPIVAIVIGGITLGLSGIFVGILTIVAPIAMLKQVHGLSTGFAILATVIAVVFSGVLSTLHERTSVVRITKKTQSKLSSLKTKIKRKKKNSKKN
jgi:hypothetical protein